MNAPSSLLKKFLSYMPPRWQYFLKRIHYARQIRKGRFGGSEPEFEMLPELIRPGDWVIDIGANIGNYTKRFSELVGKSGRVVAFEPVPVTFALLSANVQLFPYENVTLVNAALSDKTELVEMVLPKLPSGLINYYQAHISSIDTSVTVLAIALDSVALTHRIALVKIDVEGYEATVLQGMDKLIRQHRPYLIIETNSNDVLEKMRMLGYTSVRMPNSPNVTLRPQ